MYMSQGIAEIWHFRKSLDNSGNAWSFFNFQGNRRNFLFFDNVQIWEMAWHDQKTTSKINQANLTLMPPITGASRKFVLTGGSK
jgi:hypothetical protein